MVKSSSKLVGVGQQTGSVSEPLCFTADVAIFFSFLFAVECPRSLVATCWALTHIYKNMVSEIRGPLPNVLRGSKRIEISTISRHDRERLRNALTRYRQAG